MGSALVMLGCQSAQLHHAAGTEGKAANELAWIVTPLSTKVIRIDGEPVPGNYKPLPHDNIQNWLAVLPGAHELTLFYETESVASAAASTVMVRTVAGNTNFVYGRAGGGIRYFSKMLNGPANEALIGHIDTRIGQGKLPCAMLPCED